MSKKFLFDKSLYNFADLQPSWWEANVANARPNIGAKLTSDETCEVAIIGGGYTGLSAAYHLAKDHHIDVRVLEAGEIGWGASGRNGGFCCMGGTQLGPRKLIKKYGLDEAKRYYQAQSSAVELVNEIAEIEGFSIEKRGHGEIIVAEKPGHFEAMSNECSLLKDQFGLPIQMIGKDEFAEHYYEAPHQHGALLVSPGFGLHPLKYCLGLGAAAEKAGAKLHPKSEVTNWEKHSGKHRLETSSGATIIADHVIVACNGFMPEHLNRAVADRALPLQSQIIVTRPLSDDELAIYNWQTETPAVNSRNVYNYYRMLPDKRFLIGGRGDFTGTPGGAIKTAQNLNNDMVRLFPEWSNVEIDYSWRGFVCFTSALRPAIGRLQDDPTVSYGFGYHGNGVNNATWIGKEIADWYAKGNDKSAIVPLHLPAVLHGMPAKFPLASMRPLYAKAGVAWHRMLDMLGR